jgi:hypothetical protein
MTLRARVEVSPVDVQIKTHLFINWTRIAYQHLVEARRARAKALSEGPQSDSFGDHLTAELEASLVAIVSSAFAIEALQQGDDRTHRPDGEPAAAVVEEAKSSA